ncbi:YbfB/YjiJ family MFS transporter [Phytomonospora sp. NPDC050363]|uniref:YbfB/YjiJ family MFS transporter n=1 Tax=Phytomonospora sp. NPDC050363 TaxID=3155642 RepID=UPI0034069AA5
MNPRTQALRLALGTAVALGFARFGYGLFVPAMRTELDWTLAEAGVLTTANGIGYLAGAAATAALARRFGAAALFRWGMGLTAATLAATALTGSHTALVLIRGAGGFTGALVFITGASLAARLAAKGAVAIYFAGAGLGVALTGGAIPPLLDGAPDRWRLGWLLLGVMAAVATVAASPGARGVEAADRPKPAGKTRGIVPMATAYALFGAGYIAYVTFLSAYLAANRVPTALVAATWALIGLSAVLAPLLWTKPLTAWPGARALAALLATLAVAAALPLARLSWPLILASALLFGSAFMMVPAAVTGRATALGGGTGLLAALTVVFAAGQSLGPWAAGALADRTGPAAALAWTAGLCAGAAILAVAGGRAKVPEKFGSK